MLESDNVILSTAYLAPIQYYSKLINMSNTVIEKHENYTKQTYRNRCAICSANGKLFLSIPVVKNSGIKTKITDIQIDYTTNWTKIHWKSIESAYKSSPFFEFYVDDLIPFYEMKKKYLFDYNIEIQNTILNLLQIDYQHSYTQYYISKVNSNDIDYREIIHPKKNISEDPHFKNIPYNQVFSNNHPFIPNLSIIDLLFNEGPNSHEILKESYII